jgi:membrane-associated phospholipid phosphatase
MSKELEPGSEEVLAKRSTMAGCPAPGPGGGNPSAPYNLPGPQVEFQAAYWLLNNQLRMPTLPEVQSKLGVAPPYPTSTATLSAEITALHGLAARRDNNLPQGALSDFINLQDPPFGAIFNASSGRTQYRVDFVNIQDSRISRLPPTLVKTGRELARMFEGETPGLVHRHALNWFLYARPEVSPPRQARIWAALDLTIYAALAAAWYYKWAAGPGISFRQRPWEYDRTLDVLYDREVADNGDGDGDPLDCPCPTPGTPRHPAYPSGHSTYSAAASHILKYFFRDAYATQQLDLLADNIGEARLWAGVHWETDHTFGQALGRAVAEVIIDQLKADCVPTLPDMTAEEICEANRNQMPPGPAELAAAENLRSAQPCPDPEDHDRIPPRPPNMPRRIRSF